MPKKEPLSLQRQAFDFVSEVIGAFLRDRGPEQAAALTFTSLFAVVPLGTLLLTLFSWLLGHQDGPLLWPQLFFHSLVPGVGAAAQPYLQLFWAHASQLNQVGLFMLVMTCLLMLNNIERAFNSIWRVKRGRLDRNALLRYWGLLTLAPMLLVLAMILSSALGTIGLLAQAQHLVHHVLPGLSMLASLLTFSGFVMMYQWLPHCRVPLQASLVSALVAMILFEMSKVLFGWFVLRFTAYQLIFGAWAAFPFLLLWGQLVWMIILFGVQVGRLWTIRQQTGVEVAPVLLYFWMLERLQSCHKIGRIMSEAEALSLVGSQSRAGEDLLQLLIDQGWITRTDQGGLVLIRDPHSVLFWDALRHLPWGWPKADDLDGVDWLWAERFRAFVEDVDRMGEALLPRKVGQLWEESDA